jgi:hypothetical protein
MRAKASQGLGWLGDAGPWKSGSIVMMMSTARKMCAGGSFFRRARQREHDGHAQSLSKGFRALLTFQAAAGSGNFPSA